MSAVVTRKGSSPGGKAAASELLTPCPESEKLRSASPASPGSAASSALFCARMVIGPTSGDARSARTTCTSIACPAIGSNALVDTPVPLSSGSGPGRLPAITIAEILMVIAPPSPAARSRRAGNRSPRPGSAPCTTAAR
ncbi:MAG: hypothetical protein A2885_14070 [Sphingopyxis sp. RIFCSPHIGHO2_01_FULL_65_24]|nr:MAG: hypothetical protein A2885_14070 [Sphingopyxis sp. RIFCSPHIGHO2_01_FULL_65_24]